MKITTSRFGEIEAEDSDIYVFPSGILGFPDCQKYIMVPHPGGGPCQWLQSCDVPEIAFVICAPQIFVADYRVSIRLEELSSIAAISLEEAHVWTILRAPPRPEKPSLNLAGPLILNETRKLGMQYIVNGSQWSHRHEIN